MNVNPNRKQARISRDDLDMILRDLGCKAPWELSTPEAISTLTVLASRHAAPFKVESR